MWLDRWVRPHGPALRPGARGREEPGARGRVRFDPRQQRHKSGLAMRFPRISRIRTDKPAAEADTVGSAPPRLLHRLSRGRGEPLPRLRPDPLVCRPCLGRMRLLLDGAPARLRHRARPRHPQPRPPPDGARGVTILPSISRGGGPGEAWWRGFFRKGPSTALRAVPLPCKCRGGLRTEASGSFRRSACSRH
jgi:hypothetical protein